jgi:hypothetical protein
MEKLPALLGVLVVIIVTLALSGVFSESIMNRLRRRFSWSNGDGQVLLWGLLILTAFSFGLLVMYLILRS